MKMRCNFLEKVRIAQNFNNTVLLDQYAKKNGEIFTEKNKVIQFLYYFSIDMESSNIYL